MVNGFYALGLFVLVANSLQANALACSKSCAPGKICVQRRGSDFCVDDPCATVRCEGTCSIEVVSCGRSKCLEAVCEPLNSCKNWICPDFHKCMETADPNEDPKCIKVEPINSCKNWICPDFHKCMETADPNEDPKCIKVDITNPLCTEYRICTKAGDCGENEQEWECKDPIRCRPSVCSLDSTGETCETEICTADCYKPKSKLKRRKKFGYCVKKDKNAY